MPEFNFGPHSLDFDTLAATNLLTTGFGTTGCALPDGEVTFVVAYGALRKERLVSATNFMGCKVVTSSCQHQLSGPRWALVLFQTMVDLELKGVYAFDCTWFYYAREATLEWPPVEAFRFFLVNHSGLVSENTRLSFTPEDHDPPPFLQPDSPQQPLWSGQDAEWRASTRDWYNQFYETTHSGRVMVLRDDSPPVFERLRDKLL